MTEQACFGWPFTIAVTHLATTASALEPGGGDFAAPEGAVGSAEAELLGLDDAAPLPDVPDASGMCHEHPASIGAATTRAAAAIQPKALPPVFSRPITAIASCRTAGPGRPEEVPGRPQDLQSEPAAAGEPAGRR